MDHGHRKLVQRIFFLRRYFFPNKNHNGSVGDLVCNPHDFMAVVFMSVEQFRLSRELLFTCIKVVLFNNRLAHRNATVFTLPGAFF